MTAPIAVPGYGRRLARQAGDWVPAVVILVAVIATRVILSSLESGLQEDADRQLTVGLNLVFCIPGESYLPVLDALSEFERTGLPDLLVLELSSYQLETTSSLGLDAAAMLNLTQDHLDRYGSLADYGRAKERIFMHCKTRVVNRDDAASLAMGQVDGALSFGLGVPQGNSQWGLDEPRKALMHGASKIIGEQTVMVVVLQSKIEELTAENEQLKARSETPAEQ